jgi:hypothetical protein
MGFWFGLLFIGFYSIASSLISFLSMISYGSSRIIIDNDHLISSIHLPSIKFLMDILCLFPVMPLLELFTMKTTILLEWLLQSNHRPL